jgi:hypothetical protein
VLSAARNGQNAPGAYSAAPPDVAFAGARLPATVDHVEYSTPQPLPFSKLVAGPPEPPAVELVAGFIEKGIATALSGRGGSNKSRLGLQIGLALQAGLPIFGKPVEQCSFVYLDYENGAKKTRFRAQKMQYRLGLPADIAGHYFDFKTMDPDTSLLALAPPLARMKENGEIELILYNWLRDHLRAIPGHKFILADSTYNILHFTGQTKNNETCVKLALSLLDRLCLETDSTMLYLFHPSYAGQERGDASGYSTAWHDAPRARLSITQIAGTPGAYNLKAEKRNDGTQGNLTLYWRDFVLLPLSDMDAADQTSRLFEACVAVALKAHEYGTPIQKQRNVEKWIKDEIERAAGLRPSEKEIKDQLASAVPTGRLRYVNGHGKTIAGYYPVETDPDTLRTSGLDTAKPVHAAPC